MAAFILVTCLLILSLFAIYSGNSGADICQQHFSAYDSYKISPVFIQFLAHILLVLAAIGLAFVCFCYFSGHIESSYIPLCILVCFYILFMLLWFCLRRFCIDAYVDHLFYTPCIGKRACVVYSDITRIESEKTTSFSGRYILNIYSHHQKPLHIKSFIDLTGLLQIINRDDVLDYTSGD